MEDSLRREDVETMSRENMKNLHEIMQVTRIVISLLENMIWNIDLSYFHFHCYKYSLASIQKSIFL